MTNFVRIPVNFEPINYDVTFIPNPLDFTFAGQLKLELEVLDETSTIVLNCLEIEISRAAINDNVAQVTFQPDSEIVTFTFNKSLNRGVCFLEIEFKGILNDRMRGFYRSIYNGKPIFTTQMEPSDARRALPCVDEPDRKATFEVTLVAQNEEVILSNMPEQERKVVPTPAGLPPPSTQYVQVKFQKTPKMSSYLLAMVIGDFDYVEDKTEDNVLIRVYAQPDKKECGEFALHFSKRVLPFYRKCFGQAYPLPKLDLIAIPDFAMGAMENWGLVTYREAALLLKEKESSLASKHLVAGIVAHELAHMWFGNLVTMKWWTHLWLNEGFARWIQFYGPDYVHPEYDIWSNFLVNVTTAAMNLDSLRTSHAIEIEVEGPEQVSEIFDSISYDKGACIINMLFNYIGADNFFKGLQAYMAEFAYKNAQTEDLWNAFSKSSGLDVEAIMSTWTKEMGYPVVHVARSKSNSNEIVIKQSRFLTTGDLTESEKRVWSIPVIICDGVDNGKVLAKPLIPPNGEDFVCPLTEFPSTGIRLNPGRVGYYRVSYEADLLDILLVNVDKMPPRDRFVLLNDAFSLAQAGQMDIETLFKVLLAFKGDGTRIVWHAIDTVIHYIESLTEHSIDPIVKSSLDHLVIKLAAPVFEKVGWSFKGPKGEESHNDIMLRPILISLLGKAGYQPVIDEARKIFASFHSVVINKSTGADDLLSQDIRATVYQIVLLHGSEAEFSQCVNLYKLMHMQVDKVRVLSALGSVCKNNANLKEKLFDFAMSEDVRKQDKGTCLTSLAACGHTGRVTLWDFIKKNFSALPVSLGTQHLFSRLINMGCSGFNTDEYLTEISGYFSTNPVPFKRAIEQVLERISLNCKCRSRDACNVEKVLLSQKF